jgi:hypothetical protein
MLQTARKQSRNLAEASKLELLQKASRSRNKRLQGQGIADQRRELPEG